MRISDWSSDVCSSDLAPDAQGRHDQGDSEIGPGGARADDTGGSQKDRKIADCVVARAYPDRAHVGVATAVAIEHEGNAAVRDQRDHPDDSHRLGVRHPAAQRRRSEEHTSELQSLMRISYAVFCL